MLASRRTSKTSCQRSWKLCCLVSREVHSFGSITLLFSRYLQPKQLFIVKQNQINFTLGFLCSFIRLKCIELLYKHRLANIILIRQLLLERSIRYAGDCGGFSMNYSVCRITKWIYAKLKWHNMFRVDSLLEPNQLQTWLNDWRRGRVGRYGTMSSATLCKDSPYSGSIPTLFVMFVNLSL